MKNRKSIKHPRMAWLQIKCPHCGTYINMVTIVEKTGGECKKCGFGMSLLNREQYEQ
jgi:phage FluMu protein Com